MKQSFTANRTAEPLRSIKICPTQISETAEQASIYRVSDSLPKPARKQGRIKPRYLPKIWKTAKYTAKTLYFLILFIGFSLMSPLWGQGKPTAIKVDEFGRVGCEQLSARSDGFAQMIKKSPDSIGLAIVYPDSKYPHRSSAAEKQIVRSFYANGLNLSQIKVVRRDLKSDEMRVEFWQIPNGADEPEYFELGWPNAFRKPPKAYIFDCSFDDGVCNTFIPEIFVDFLKADPDLRGNIVIRGYSRTDRKNVGEEWITTFRKLGLPRSRLKVFYATAKNMSYAEFLIVPIKKN